MMANSSSELLALDCKLPPMSSGSSYSMLIKSFGDQQQQSIITDQTHHEKLQDFLSQLEQERLKIDAFKRELPLCMQLLTNAMETSRQQLQTYHANQGPRPVLEEFIPLQQSSPDGSEKTLNMSDKANWMTSAQLWSQTNDGTKQQSTISSPKETDIGFIVSSKLGLDAKQRNGGAFLPFSKERNSCPGQLGSLPELALASSDKLEIEDKKFAETDNGMSNYSRRSDNPSKVGSLGMVIDQGKGVTVPADSQTTTISAATTTSSQTHRKARRCWSPDLHRRFVNALQMLGGSQVATPKQIRELMKVDGLTNDEVKSHLQKYRLHTRRPSPSPQAAGNQAPQLVVLGSIWVPPEYAAAHHGGVPTLYGAHPSSHHASPHYPVPQEYYSAAIPPQAQAHHQLHHHTLHHQLHVYKPSPQTHSSPESDIRCNTGDQSESIEDGKSESSSWKADSGSGHNGGERKGLELREDGEESNGSDITLKF